MGPSTVSITSSEVTSARSPCSTIPGPGVAGPALRLTTSHACPSRAPGEQRQASRTNTVHEASQQMAGSFREAPCSNNSDGPDDLLRRFRRPRPSDSSSREKSLASPHSAEEVPPHGARGPMPAQALQVLRTSGSPADLACPPSIRPQTATESSRSSDAHASLNVSVPEGPSDGPIGTAPSPVGSGRGTPARGSQQHPVELEGPKTPMLLVWITITSIRLLRVTVDGAAHFG